MGLRLDGELASVQHCLSLLLHYHSLHYHCLSPCLFPRLFPAFLLPFLGLPLPLGGFVGTSIYLAQKLSGG